MKTDVLNFEKIQGFVVNTDSEGFEAYHRRVAASKKLEAETLKQAERINNLESKLSNIERMLEILIKDKE